ncbi:26S proteasome non-ATPase regulatory subunit 5 [Trichoplax sp. H2]|nr:26S proteasome non-ATPase regulatory subunit 5 [Trichoplax sp. H2]|eukprot:RDD39887.1 26S proteasome non-ATPase regulatory subunit 5 [Trichoplax sp. H2]
MQPSFNMSLEMQANKVLQELPASDDKLVVLHRLNVIVKQMNENEVTDLVHHHRLDNLIQCLSINDSIIVGECVQILQTLFNQSPIDFTFHQYKQPLMLGILHEMSCVRELSLSCHIATIKVGYSDPVKDFVKLVINQGISNDLVNVASFSIKSLLAIARCESDGLELIFNEEVISDIQRLDWDNDTLRFRIYELFINILSISHRAMTLSMNTGILNKLMHELESDDPLLRMNCIEFLIQLQQTTFGWHYLQSFNILYTLNKLLVDSANDPLSSFIVPRILVFYGHLTHSSSTVNFIEVNEKYPTFMEVTVSSILSRDQSILNIALDTFGAIASCNQGRQSLLSICKEQQIHKVMSRIGEIVTTENTSTRLRALDALSEIYRNFPDEVRHCACLQDWYDALNPSVASMLQKLSNQPFPDIRCAALKLLANLAQFEWTQRDISRQPGMIEFILDRKVEQDKSCLEAKFDIVVVLTESKYAIEVFGGSMYVELQQHVKEGPFFVLGEANVAMEAE